MMMCLFALRELNAFTSVTSVVIFLTSLDGFGCAWIVSKTTIAQMQKGVYEALASNRGSFRPRLVFVCGEKEGLISPV